MQIATAVRLTTCEKSSVERRLLLVVSDFAVAFHVAEG